MYIWVKNSNNEIIFNVFKWYSPKYDFLYLNNNDEILEYTLNDLERQRNKKISLIHDGEQYTILKINF